MTVALFAVMHDFVLEFVREHTMADFGRHPLLLFKEYYSVCLLVSLLPGSFEVRERVSLKHDHATALTTAQFTRT